MFERSFQQFGLIDSCSLSLDWLFDHEPERAAFVSRFHDFIGCDESLARITSLTNSMLHYKSESFLPTLARRKPSLFFIVGNPAPDSVARGAMYAYEGSGDRQHRFWRVLHATGVLRFSDEADAHSPQQKMRKLFAGEYCSPFNVHVIPFFSLASPTGGAWSGVSGLRRLFGRSFTRIVTAERSALNELLQGRIKQGDCILTFQKDAYQALKESDAPNYDGVRLRDSAIESRYGSMGADLVCLPPTRLFYCQVTRSALERLTGNSGYSA